MRLASVGSATWFVQSVDRTDNAKVQAVRGKDMNSKNDAAEHSAATDGSTVTIVAELQNLMRAEVINPEHDCTAAEVSAAICSLLSEIVLASDTECDKLTDWEQEIRSLRCKIVGEHEWTYDHCCYWGHQYCLGCHERKYPELSILSCTAAIEKIGRIKESEYVPSP